MRKLTKDPYSSEFQLTKVNDELMLRIKEMITVIYLAGAVIS